MAGHLSMRRATGDENSTARELVGATGGGCDVSQTRQSLLQPPGSTATPCGFESVFGF